MAEQTRPTGLPPLRGQFVSDTHLFHPRNGAALKHLQMLFMSDAPIIYLNGDSVDFLALEEELAKKGYQAATYPRRFNDVLKTLNTKTDTELQLRVIDTLLWKADSGTHVVVIGGNHDPGFDLLDGQEFYGITCCKQDIYDAGEGLKCLVEHGRRFDPAFLQNFSGLYGIASLFLDAGLRVDQGLGKLVPSPLPEPLAA